MAHPQMRMQVFVKNWIHRFHFTSTVLWSLREMYISLPILSIVQRLSTLDHAGSSLGLISTYNLFNVQSSVHRGSSLAPQSREPGEAQSAPKTNPPCSPHSPIEESRLIFSPDTRGENKRAARRAWTRSSALSGRRNRACRWIVFVKND